MQMQKKWKKKNSVPVIYHKFGILNYCFYFLSLEFQFKKKIKNSDCWKV